MRLQKEDWNQLDDLLSKAGFGGYYDLIELIRDDISKLEPRATDISREEDDLLILMLMLGKVINAKVKL